ncbi:MAG: ATP-binding protein [Epsilonproteobacteria bacterium]|nr:ATP-binding protein [Campylobacterota bacterium]
MIERKLLPIILEMLEIFRIVAINGPRQSGKTTLQKLVAKKKGIKYYTFDDEQTLQTASNDPIGFIEFISKDNVAIDEVQMIPSVIPAIKMVVDEKNRKGMFLLTGSSDMFKNSKIKESLAGRLASFNLFPLSYSEINGKSINIIDKFFSKSFNNFEDNFEDISNLDVTNAVLRGGYPEVYQLPFRARKAWFEFYIKARISKDIATIENIELSKLKEIDRLLRALSAQIGSIVNYKKISNSVAISDKSVAKYIQILEALYIIKLVPSFANNQLKRVIKSPKIQFIDTGLASILLNIDVEGAMTKQGEFYGNLVESFVYSELIKHQSWAEISTNIYHYRDGDKKEVDFVLEASDGRVIAIEVKSGSKIKKEYFYGLVTLARTLKEKSFKGILLYGGNQVLPYKVEEYQFWAIPLKVFL